LLTLAAAAPGTAHAACGPDRIQSSGAVYRICMPPPDRYNGALVVWGVGFQDAGKPVEIPEDQLGHGAVPAFYNALGFAFAVSSYSKTGLAIRQGVNDLLDLVDLFRAQEGTPQRVYMIGASEGGIITTLLVEQHPDVFDAGVAACGPIGDFPGQINYLGDARVTFEYFFPGLIPGPLFDPPLSLVQNWDGYYKDVVRPNLLDKSNRDRLEQWVRVAQLAVDPADYVDSAEEAAGDVLSYFVQNIQDAVATLGGFPYDNATRVYSGSDDDQSLNAAVPRVTADPRATAEMLAHYTTSGNLKVPLITLHTLLDPLIPYAHEDAYLSKTAAYGVNGRLHVNLPVQRFGHCNFEFKETLIAMYLMLAYDGALGLLR